MKNFEIEIFEEQYEAHFVISSYVNGGGLYVGIELEDGEPWGDVSTNLEFDLPENCIAIKQYDFGPNNFGLLNDLGIVDGVLGTVEQGFGKYQIVSVNFEKLLEYGYVLQ